MIRIFKIKEMIMIDFILGAISGCTLTTIAFTLWVTPKIDEARDLIKLMQLDLNRKQPIKTIKSIVTND